MATQTTSGSAEVMALQSCEEDIIDCLEGADLGKLAKQGQEIYVIPPEVRERFEALDCNVSSVLKIRYLLLHANKQLEAKPKLFTRLLKVLENHGVKPVIIGKLRQAFNGPDESHGAIVLGKRPPIQGKCLFRKDISLLVELLANYSSKWYDIGMALNLPNDTLKQLNALTITPGGTACLGTVISEWIEGKHADAKPPTVEYLKTALQSKTVGLGDVACEVADHFQSQDTVIEEVPSAKKPCLDTLFPCLEIVCQSSDVVVAEDECTLLQVQVAPPSDSSVSYQWVKDGSPLQEGGEFQGVNEPILSLADASLGLAGTYICEINSSESPSSSLSSEPIQVVVTASPLKKILIDRYAAQPEVPEDSWPPVSNNTYINLALIKQGNIDKGGEYARSTIQGNMDDVIADKDSIEYESAFSNLESGTRLLVEGRPGSGKTTLVHKYSRDWAIGNHKLNFRGIKLLFLVHLRGFFNDPNIKLRDIVQNYFTEDESAVEEIVRYTTSHCGEGMCFILDGLDEYTPTKKNSTFIFRLVKKEIFPKAVVIVASRPESSARFRKVSSKHIEVVGFLKEQIFEYVEKYHFSNASANGLHTYLDQHPNVCHMCYLPIHTAMVCYLYDVMGSKLPRTETKMYTEFTKHTLLRTFSREEESDISYLESPDHLPAREKALFLKICELGFEKTKSSKQVLSKGEVHSFFKDVSSGKDSLGLITVDCMARICGFENLYTFLHLTFQEYLAAYHIKEEKQKGLGVLRCSNNKKHMQVVWKFYCGLVDFNEDGEFASLMDSTRLKRDDDLFCVQCAFESQQSIACDYVVKSGALSFTNHFLTPSDFTAIGYAMCHGSCPVTKLTFNKCNLSTEGITAFLEEIKDKVSSITTICFHHKACVTEQLVTLKWLLKEAVSLKVLDISDTNLGPNKIQQLTDNLTLSSLTTVLLTPPANLDEVSLKRLTFGSSLQQFVFRGGDISQSQLKKALQHDDVLCLRSLSTLPEVYMHRQKLYAKGAEHVSEGLQQLSCCASLDLFECFIGDSGCHHLANGLMGCKELHTLNLCSNEIGDSGCHHLANGLMGCKELHTLNLCSNEIGDSGAKCLARIFSACKSIRRLDLGVNNIGDTGAITLAEAIQTCTKLHTLDLSYNFITDAGASALAERIPCLTDLELLHLKCNRIGDEGAIAIAKAVSNDCKLEIWNHRISKNGADMIVELHRNVGGNFQSFSIQPYTKKFRHISSIVGDTEELKNLEVLDMEGCDPDYNLMFAFIKKCTHLKILNFVECYSCCSAEVLKIIMDGIKSCSHLQVLNLSKNSMGKIPMCFTQLSNGLKQPRAYNLLTLNLGWNHINVDCMVALADGLKQCSSLQNLGLVRNEIDQKGALVLSECFSHLPNLQIFNLHSNNISVSAPNLIDALKHCKNLTTLNIGYNNIGFEGAVAIAKNIILYFSCRDLQSFNLEGNNIGTSGAVAIINALEHCKSICELNISWNNIGPDCVNSIVNFVKSSNSLQSLVLEGSNLGVEGKEIVTECLTNKGLLV